MWQRDGAAPKRPERARVRLCAATKRCVQKRERLTVASERQYLCANVQRLCGKAGWGVVGGIASARAHTHTHHSGFRKSVVFSFELVAVCSGGSVYPLLVRKKPQKTCEWWHKSRTKKQPLMETSCTDTTFYLFQLKLRSALPQVSRWSNILGRSHPLALLSLPPSSFPSTPQASAAQRPATFTGFLKALL